MNIIGKTQNGYIVTLDRNEMANLCGFYWKDGDDFLQWLAEGRIGHDHGDIHVGSSIPVGEWWHRLRAIREREKELTKLSETLRGLADLVSGAWPMITAETP